MKTAPLVCTLAEHYLSSQQYKASEGPVFRNRMVIEMVN